MLQRSKFSAKVLTGLMSLGLLGAIATASNPGNATPADTNSSGQSNQGQSNQACASGTQSSGSTMSSRTSSSRSAEPDDQTPVNITQPGVTERPSAARLPENSVGGAAQMGTVDRPMTSSPSQTASPSATSAEAAMPSRSTPDTTAGATPGAATDTDCAQSMSSQSENLGTVLGNEGSFKTLSAAIQAAGLEETLDGTGPLTLFAPTDAAFAALPPEALNQLLQPQNREVLRQILTYHVVQGNLTSTAIQPGDVRTVEGSSVAIATDAGGVTVAGATVVQPDIVAKNGVIHAIDRVLLPPSLQMR